MRTRNEDDMRRNETPEQREIRIKRFEKVGKAHRWKPGQSGNPSGKGKSHFDVAKSSRKAGPAVVRFWNAVMNDGKMPIGQRMRASENLMNRGFGKPIEPLHVDGSVQIDHRAAHLQALVEVNKAHDEAKRNGRLIEAKCNPDVTQDADVDREQEDNIV